MKTHYQQKFVAVATALVLVAAASLILNHKVSAAGDGSITGTVKLSGTAPHMKPIDMSKDPYCVKQHADNPASLENVVVGSSGGVKNVVLYISQGLTGNEASAVSSEEPTFD